jgi:hypothetical protein
MGWAAFIVSLIKTIPLIHDVFMKVVELYYVQMDAKDEANSTQVGMERDKIIAELRKKGLTDEERNKLRKDLYSLSRR